MAGGCDYQIGLGNIFDLFFNINSLLYKLCHQMQLRKLRKKICKFGLNLKCGLDISLGDTYKLLNLYLVKNIQKK